MTAETATTTTMGDVRELPMAKTVAAACGCGCGGRSCACGCGCGGDTERADPERS